MWQFRYSYNKDSRFHETPGTGRSESTHSLNPKTFKNPVVIHTFTFDSYMTWSQRGRPTKQQDYPKRQTLETLNPKPQIASALELTGMKDNRTSKPQNLNPQMGLQSTVGPSCISLHLPIHLSIYLSIFFFRLERRQGCRQGSRSEFASTPRRP